MPSLGDLLAELTSGDEVRAEAAASALAVIPESSLPALESLLESKESDHRWWAVRTLAQMEQPTLSMLVRALDDPATEVRQAAALALVAHAAEEAAPSLIQTLNDDDDMVRTLAVDALVAMGKKVIPALLSDFPDASRRARVQIMRALAEIRDYRAIPVMMQAMEDDSAMLYYWAQKGLEWLGLDMVYINPQQ